MSKRVTSRRARLEQQKARRTLLISLLISVILIALFLFVLMPVLFDAAIRFSQSDTPLIGNTDTLPPQKPAFQPPLEHQNTSELKLEGYTEAGSQVNLYINGQIKDSQAATEDGNFSFTSSLEEGEHELVVTANDEAGNESSSNAYQIKVDLTSPTLAISEPANGAIFTLRSERVVNVIGQLSEQGRVYVNGSIVTTNEEGQFQTSLALGEGENEIKVTGEDLAGNTAPETLLKVRYQP